MMLTAILGPGIHDVCTYSQRQYIYFQIRDTFNFSHSVAFITAQVIHGGWELPLGQGVTMQSNGVKGGDFDTYGILPKMDDLGITRCTFLSRFQIWWSHHCTIPNQAGKHKILTKPRRFQILTPSVLDGSTRTQTRFLRRSWIWTQKFPFWPVAPAIPKMVIWAPGVCRRGSGDLL